MLNVFLLIVLNTFTYAEAAVLNFSPSSTNINQGDSVAVDVVISDLDNTGFPSISAFQIDIEYDPNILKLLNIGFSDQLNNSNGGSSLQREDFSYLFSPLSNWQVRNRNTYPSIVDNRG
jgi:hypothetical protein